MINAKYGALLIGVVTTKSKKVVLFPGNDYSLQASDLGILIAEDIGILNLIEKMDFNAESLPHSHFQSSKSAENRIEAASIYKSMDNDPLSSKDNRSRSALKRQKKNIVEMVVESIDPVSVTEHIVVVGNWIDILSFISQIRSYKLRVHKPIVAFSSILPPDNIARKISTYSNVFIVQGNSSDMEDLSRAGIQR